MVGGCNQADVTARLSRALAIALTLIVPSKIAFRLSGLLLEYWFLLIFILVVGGWALAARAHQRKNWREIAGLVNSTYLPGLAGGASLILVLALYVTCRSPRHAMKPQYLLVASPFIFVMIGQIFDRLPGRKTMRAWLPVILLIFQAAYGTITTLFPNKQDQPIVLHRSSIPVILDSEARGVVPRVLWGIDGQTRVFVARQSSILEEFPILPEDDTIWYVGDLRYGNTMENRERILEEIQSRGYSLDWVEEWTDLAVTIYQFNREGRAIAT